MKNPYDKQIGGSHYQKFKIQPSKFVIENELLYPEGCVIKYILRHRLKGKKQDLEKAIHFIEMIIERDYVEKNTCTCGRSPTGDCIGWHKLTEEHYKKSLAHYNKHTPAIDGVGE